MPKETVPQEVQTRRSFEILRRSLEGTFAGSPIVQAIADTAALAAVQSRIDHKRRTLKEPLSDDGFMEDLVQKAAINETIRKGEFGEEAAVYGIGCGLADGLLREYNVDSKKQGDTSRSDEQIKEGAAYRLRFDLWYLNKHLPKRK